MPCRATVLVHHDREVQPALAHLVQHRGTEHVLSHEVRRSNQVLEHDQASLPDHGQEIFGQDVAHYLVEVALVDREA
jgi:hypothetical protein